MELFEFLSQVPYLPTIIDLLLAAHALAIAIVNLTDTPKDNQYLALVYRYIEFFAGIIRASKVKQPKTTDTP